MNGNFDRVNLHGDDKIKVEGWLSWDPGDQKADLSIAVTQGTVSGLEAERWSPQARPSGMRDRGRQGFVARRDRLRSGWRDRHHAGRLGRARAGSRHRSRSE